MRKQFQGVGNIIRFNWHFFVLALLVIIGFRLLIPCFFDWLKIWFNLFLLIVTAGILLSLFVSHYIYDRSNLYELTWLNKYLSGSNATVVNINAGFDESSVLLKQKFPGISLQVMDFYNPEKHTEVSIKRARKAYPPYPGTIAIDTRQVSLASNSSDLIVLFFAAHEIRNENERIQFFSQLQQALSENGAIAVTEHLRDWPNSLAYSIGVFHFFSKRSWFRVFSSAKLKIVEEHKTTPFITTFILRKDGTTT